MILWIVALQEPVSVDQYFDLLKETLDRIKDCPNRTYNCDGSGSSRHLEIMCCNLGGAIFE